MDISEDVLFSTLAQLTQKEANDQAKQQQRPQQAFEVIKHQQPIKKVDVDKGKQVDNLTDNDLDENQCEIDSTSDLLERKYDQLKVNGMKTNKENFKYLVSRFLTNEELIYNSRKGKKNPKSGSDGANHH